MRTKEYQTEQYIESDTNLMKFYRSPLIYMFNMRTMRTNRSECFILVYSPAFPWGLHIARIRLLTRTHNLKQSIFRWNYELHAHLNEAHSMESWESKLPEEKKTATPKSLCYFYEYSEPKMLNTVEKTVKSEHIGF